MRHLSFLPSGGIDIEGEYAPQAPVACDTQCHRVVFSVAYVREKYLSCHRREECAWGTESVDAKSIVGSVLISPFVMAYESGGIMLPSKSVSM